MSEDVSPSLRILIVDDDELMGACYTSIFRRQEDEFQWRWEPRPERALDHLKEQRFDALILDWDMPGMSGGDVLDRIRSSPALKDTPVLVITGRAGAANETMVLQHGADDYLPKPFSPDVMLARLRGLLRR